MTDANAILKFVSQPDGTIYNAGAIIGPLFPEGDKDLQHGLDPLEMEGRRFSLLDFKMIKEE